MGLFFGNRDAKMVTHFAREIVERVIDITVDFYKQNVVATSENIYGEAIQKSYYDPVRVHALVVNNSPVNNTGDFGYDVTENTTFKILRETLKDLDFIPEVGDMVFYLGNWFELVTVYDEREWGGLDPNNMEDNPDRGLLVGYILEATRTREGVV